MTQMLLGLNFRTDWSTGGAVSDLTINSDNAIKKYESVDFIGLEASASYDISGMSTLNFSVYKTGDADLLVKVYDLGADDTWQGIGNGDDSEGTFTVTTAAQDDWTEVSIDIANLTGLGNNGENVTQLVFDITGDNTETIYIDDIYYAV